MKKFLKFIRNLQPVEMLLTMLLGLIYVFAYFVAIYTDNYMRIMFIALQIFSSVFFVIYLLILYRDYKDGDGDV